MQQRKTIAGAKKSLNPVTGVLTAVALTATVVFGGNEIVKTQSEGTGPVSVDQASADFSSGANTVVSDAAVATQGGQFGPKTVKEFSRDKKFSMFALTWQKPGEFASYVRSQKDDGSWGPWLAAAPMEERGPQGQRGTDLIYVESTKKVQVSVAGVDLGIDQQQKTSSDNASQKVAPSLNAAATGPTTDPAKNEGQAPSAAPGQPADKPAQPAPGQPASSNGLAPLPSNFGDIRPVAEQQTLSDDGPIKASDIKAVFIDGNSQKGGITPTAATDGMPPVVTRAQWGADPSLRMSDDITEDRAVVVHHTAGSNNYSKADAPGIVRGIQTYHGATLGWGDIGYNALVDKYGTIYEGRAGGMDKGIEGAHVGGFNQNTWAISMLGNYDNAQPTQEAINAVGQLAGWKAANANFDPKTTTRLTADSNYPGNKYAAGQGDTFQRISGHRDFQYNTCPGQNLYDQLGQIRDIAERKYQSLKNPAPQKPTSTSTAQKPADKKPEQKPSEQKPTTTQKPADQKTADQKPADQKPAQVPSNPDYMNVVKALLSGDPRTIMAQVGSLAVILVTAALGNGGSGLADAIKNIGNLKIFDKVKISDLPSIIAGSLSKNGSSDVEKKWKQVQDTNGPVLGDAKGGVANTGTGAGSQQNKQFALFTGGIITTGDKGTNALWGPIADTWAGQGYDVGPLGLPVADQTKVEDGKFKAEFQHGWITWDKKANQVYVDFK